MKICKICGKEFKSNPPQKIYCSSKCRKKGDREQDKKWRKKNNWNQKRKKKYNTDKEYRKRVNEANMKIYWKNREKILEYQRKRRIELYQLLKKFLGDKCVICNNKPNKILFHEVHGKSHHSGAHYILNHHKDFVPMCTPCHRSLHIYHKYKSEVESLERNMREIGDDE